MLLLDDLFDTFDLALQSVEYDHRHQTVEATMTFTIPISRFQDAHEDLALRFDDHDDDDWEISVRDYDDGTEVAWFTFVIEARSVEACRHLHARLAPAPLWFEETSNA